MPALEFDFRIAVALNPEPSRVDNKVKKEITTVAAGQWSGSFGNGRVLVRAALNAPLLASRLTDNAGRLEATIWDRRAVSDLFASLKVPL